MAEILIALLGIIIGAISLIYTWFRTKKTDFEVEGDSNRILKDLSEKVKSLENTCSKLDEKFFIKLDNFKKETRDNQNKLESKVERLNATIEQIAKNIDRILEKLWGN